MPTQGVITALITPLNSDGTLCIDCLKEMIEFQVRSGVHGLYLTGTAGEGVILPTDIRMKVYEKVLEYAPSKLYLLPHVGAASVDVVINLAKHAKDLGYREVSMIAPIFHKPVRKGLVKYFEYVASKIELDIIIYNNKDRQGYNVSPDDFQAIVSTVSSVKGIKDTSKDVTQLLDYVSRFGDKYFIAGAGDDLLFYTFIINAHAHICAVSNVIPEIVVELYNKVKEGRVKEALDLQNKVNQFRKVVAKLGVETQEALRQLVKLRGVDSGYPPVQMAHDIDPKLVEEAKKVIESIIPRR
uniref:Dihydrodipicolinate synthase family protein n=1 Tax=Ignisphaera aggregans TaxID=334771 RepID=A0A7C2VLM9_9CREN